MIDIASRLSTPTYVRLREQLRSDIVAGVWRLGQHITLAELTQHYGVGANPAREALLQLQGEGLVDMRMHRGAVVRSVDARFVKNIYDLRGAIEGMLAAEASRLIADEDLDGIAAAVEAFERAAREGEVDAIVRANRALHRRINDTAQNGPAMEVLEGRSTLVDALRRSIGYRTERLTEVVAQHRAFLHALTARDPDRAAAAAIAHTMSARDDLLAHLAQHGAA
jgi:DNA-binding GntR family transcriptional regulator